MVRPHMGGGGSMLVGFQTKNPEAEDPKTTPFDSTWKLENFELFSIIIYDCTSIYTIFSNCSSS